MHVLNDKSFQESTSMDIIETQEGGLYTDIRLWVHYYFHYYLYIVWLSTRDWIASMAWSDSIFNPLIWFLPSILTCKQYQLPLYPSSSFCSSLSRCPCFVQRTFFLGLFHTFSFPQSWDRSWVGACAWERNCRMC